MLQEDFIFYPDNYFIGDPAGWGMPFEDVIFSTGDGFKLHGWFVPGKGDITLLWCHGNAGNISYRLDNLQLLHERLGVNIFLFDYRGYGLSQGKPTEEGTYLDAEAALEHLSSSSDIDKNSIVIFGRSLGGAVAVDLASRHPCLGLILESTFSSVGALFPGLVAEVLPIQYNSIDKIGRIKAPLLMLHGDIDEVVPYASGQELFAAANEPKQFYTIVGAGHNDTYLAGGEDYIAAWQRFIAGLGRP